VLRDRHLASRRIDLGGIDRAVDQSGHGDAGSLVHVLVLAHHQANFEFEPSTKPVEDDTFEVGIMKPPGGGASPSSKVIILVRHDTSTHGATATPANRCFLRRGLRSSTDGAPQNDRVSAGGGGEIRTPGGLPHGGFRKGGRPHSPATRDRPDLRPFRLIERFRGTAFIGSVSTLLPRPLASIILTENAVMAASCEASLLCA